MKDTTSVASSNFRIGPEVKQRRNIWTRFSETVIDILTPFAYCSMGKCPVLGYCSKSRHRVRSIIDTDTGTHGSCTGPSASDITNNNESSHILSTSKTSVEHFKQDSPLDFQENPINENAILTQKINNSMDLNRKAAQPSGNTDDDPIILPGTTESGVSIVSENIFSHLVYPCADLFQKTTPKNEQ
ncbi:unnamed protein product [Allacma fusca]|uniref:Uncharacterized protein n=1 Tax=Allacma fusca TaxID=39272 RepID=A0A8J2KR50_9HEXA|nr:unnamed protein product [Allacma fusca]